MWSNDGVVRVGATTVDGPRGGPTSIGWGRSWEGGWGRSWGGRLGLGALPKSSASTHTHEMNRPSVIVKPWETSQGSWDHWF